MLNSSAWNKDTSKIDLEVYVIAAFWQNTKACNAMMLTKNMFSCFYLDYFG